jgi:excisionase family DNA binding protein
MTVERVPRGDALTVKEAAAIARVSPATIRRWCRRGHVRAFQVGPGASIRIPADELRALLARLPE